MWNIKQAYYSVQPQRLWNFVFCWKMWVKMLIKFKYRYGQKLFDHATDVLKMASKRTTQKTEEATCDLIGNEIANKITKVSRNLPQNSQRHLKVKLKIYDLIGKFQKEDIYLKKEVENHCWSKIDIVV